MADGGEFPFSLGRHAGVEWGIYEEGGRCVQYWSSQEHRLEWMGMDDE